MEIKAGLEIHQQLDTGKLFCRCPSVLRSDEPDWVVERKLHAVAGEAGEVDIAARYEAEQKRKFRYEGYRDTNCLLEYDEQPPLEIDQEALKIAIQISLLLNSEILPVAQIMRKTVLDGSNTSGFQRTVRIARNGWIDTEQGKVTIESVSLEEDSARIIKREKDKAIFRLDRLGIPLVEIGTAPEMKDAEQVKEVALKIGEVLRASKVKRGIGTIRQDVNISTSKHPRVEIKGFQDPKMFVETIEWEAERQKKEGKKAEAHVRKAESDGTTSFLRPMPGAARMYPETDLPLLKISRRMIDEAKKTLPKLREDIKGELKKKGLSEEMISQLLGSGRLEDFEALIKVHNQPNFVAKLLLILPKDLAVRYDIEAPEEVFSMDVLETILEAVAKKKISERDVKAVMVKIAAGKGIDEALKVEKIDLSEVEAEAARIVKAKPGLSMGAYMGLIMDKFKGKVSGSEASEILRKLIKIE